MEVSTKPGAIHSDSHGKGKAGVKAAPRHAELAVNLSGSMALFLLATRGAKLRG
ncbi:abortive infection family protein [Pseudomonas alliivorans]|nr:abortive infection family protein [Pseudomonas alliivorans]